MLPHKNELNDETLEKISGGHIAGIMTLKDFELLAQNNGGNSICASDESGVENTGPTLPTFFTCPTCGNTYSADAERQDGRCSYCETKTLERQTIVGDIQASLPMKPKKLKRN